MIKSFCNIWKNTFNFNGKTKRKDFWLALVLQIISMYIHCWTNSIKRTRYEKFIFQTVYKNFYCRHRFIYILGIFKLNNSWYT